MDANSALHKLFLSECTGVVGFRGALQSFIRAFAWLGFDGLRIEHLDNFSTPEAEEQGWKLITRMPPGMLDATQYIPLSQLCNTDVDKEGVTEEQQEKDNGNAEPSGEELTNGGGGDKMPRARGRPRIKRSPEEESQRREEIKRKRREARGEKKKQKEVEKEEQNESSDRTAAKENCGQTKESSGEHQNPGDDQENENAEVSSVGDGIGGSRKETSEAASEETAAAKVNNC